jgi:hypothetical protein
MVEQVSQNPLQQQHYRIIFDRLPGVELNCLRVRVPGLQLGPAIMNTPVRPLAFEGDQLQKDGALQIEFKLDENLQGYLGIFNWMSEMRPLDDTFTPMEYENRRSDITIQILDSALKLNFEVEVQGAFPVNLSGFQLDSTITNVDPVIIDGSFEYVQHKFVSKS